jgi:uncharacterized protein (TIGR03083 family)
MTTFQVEQTQSVGALRAASAQFTELLRAVRKPDTVAIGHWTISDTAAHVSHTLTTLLDVAKESGSPLPDHTAGAAFNEERLQKDKERDLVVLAERIDDLTNQLVDALQENAWDGLVVWQGGIKIARSTVSSIYISEVLVHGHDIARAGDKGWHIARQHAAIALQGLAELLPFYVDREAAADFHACYDVNIRSGAQLYFVFEDGSLVIEAPSSRSVDCHISADPGTFLLVGYGRVGQWGPVLRGQLIAWGKKPWLGVKLTSLLKNP